MAEKLLQHALAVEDTPLNQIEIVSAGVAAGYGSQPQPTQWLRLKETRPWSTQSQPLTQDLIDRAFLILEHAVPHRYLNHNHTGLLTCNLFVNLWAKVNPPRFPTHTGKTTSLLLVSIRWPKPFLHLLRI